jgi:FkbM family methyltransferase
LVQSLELSVAPRRPSAGRRLAKKLRTAVRLPGLTWQGLRRVQALGAGAAWQLWRAHVAFWAVPREDGRDVGQAVAIRLKGHSHPFYFRPLTSDVFVIDQVFLNREYDPVVRECDPEFVIDCGANIGCASVYFLERYPKARVIALEPDAGNYEVCRRNLEPYGDRAVVLKRAVWSADTGLRLEPGVFRDGLEWSCQVRPCRAGEAADVEAVSLPTLLREYGADRIDLLKIDVEGAEVHLFDERAQEWLGRTDCLAVELHDQACVQALQRSLEGLPFTQRRVGELTICKRSAAD